MPIINRPPVGRDKDEEHYEVLIKRQTKDDKNQGTPRNYVSIPIGSTVVVEWEQKWELHMTPLVPGLPSPATMLFNCPIRGIMPIINRPPVGRDRLGK